jgi:two-component system, cell cycle sensor histidine kinase and response regulator CckA
MPQLKRSPFHRGVFVVALTAVALIISLLLQPVLDPGFFPLFLTTVLLSSWYYGLGGGLLASALATAAVFYFFLPHSLPPALPSLARLISFVAMALVVTWLTSSWRSSRGLLKATLSSIGDAVIATDKAGRVTFLNPVAEGLTGWKRHEARGKDLGAILKLIHEQTKDAIDNPLKRAISEGAAVTLPPHTLLLAKDDTELPIEDSAAPIRDDSGNLRGAVMVFRDVTSRRQLEEQLSHAQKMDAVGRLAGGVAGDFNNLLTVITGYSELLRTELASNDSLKRFADEILYAAERAAGLTRQLLAFSKGQQTQARLLDLNAVVTNMEAMLRRLVGEQIETIILPGAGLGRVKADPAQIEQVVMNLATNARDAMPGGGKLVLETANVDFEDEPSAMKVGVKPGSYVMLAASDTGIGMDTETRSRLFEPFFTTKKQGQGSGLGLSTVYGIVKQSEGHITVYSQVGCGSIFEVYLPRVSESEEKLHGGKRREQKGSETILLVDDEDGVRKLVQAILQSHGYSVIEANNGVAALSAYEKNSHKIDLVLTDVVMPQMNGFELGERLSDAKPEQKILYMSGYRDNPIGNAPGGLNRAFLHKPFTPDTLLTKVRQLLDEAPADA